MSSVQVPPRKRRKTQLACNPCRARKSGCDGARPVCSACRSKGLQQQCAYQESVLRTSSTPTLSELHQRLQRLESSPAPPGLPPAGASPLPGPTVPEAAPVLPVSTTVGNGLGRTSPPGTDRGPAKTSSAHGANHRQTTTSSHDDETVYGPSSNISFLRQVTQAADPQNSSHSPDDEQDKATDCTPTVLGFSAAQPKSPDPPPEPLMLPERWLADDLLASFWEFVHPVFPILHRPSFAASYDALWQPGHGRGRHDFKDVVFHSTLSIALALGAQRIPEQASLAEKFYRQSIRLVSVDALDHSSLQVVQLLLLRGVYLHYTSYADRCWNTVGVALRVAQGLGLHREGNGKPSQLRREMRRRVWHCCLTLDRLTATTFGRPVLISRPNSIPVPATIDDEYLSETVEGEQPRNRPSYLVFFVHSLELFDVLGDVLAKFYEDADDHTAGELSQSLSDVLRLSSRLDDISDSFPPYTREEACLTDYDDDLAACLQMQANILKSRVLWIRLLLLRPLLLAEARRDGRSRNDKGLPDSSPTLQGSLGRAANALCVDTAHAVLQEMYEKLGSVRQNSAWHVLLFTFAAASTLVVATLCPGLQVSFDTEPARTSWDRALRIFDFNKKHVASAARGIEVLERFRASVVAVSEQDVRLGKHGIHIEKVREARLTKTNRIFCEEENQETQAEGGDTLLPFNSLPASTQTPMIQDLSDFLNSDLLNESWFNMQGIDFSSWSVFQ
ncbi:transcriptional regulatory protein [Colletotrichum musicola]|uniref:Transcriptional regulatory protein n=1 Tax=Colletotrichum musicola TaxID=2175873 RepID=A0A8H6NG43_9PEZI|nr:transcriptional regulatory protein [Colletotrichum musicola]